MLSTNAKRVGRNMLGLVFVIFPIWYSGIWLIEQTRHGPQGGGLLEMLAFNWLTASLPLLAGGLLHEGLMWAIPASLRPVQRRCLAVASTLIVPVILIAVDVNPDRYTKWGRWPPCCWACLCTA